MIVEQVKENVKEIEKMRRQFARESYKLKSTDKQLNKELKKMIDKKEPAVIFQLIQQRKKQIAQNILKNQRFIAKYQQLDGQLQNTQFQ